MAVATTSIVTIHVTGWSQALTGLTVRPEWWWREPRGRGSTSHVARGRRDGYDEPMKNSDELSQGEQPQETNAEQREHLQAVLAKLSDVMLLTYEATGAAPLTAARPMHVTKLEPDGTLWFMASIDSRKSEQLRQYPGASVIAQDSSRWLSMRGHVQVVSDRAQVHALWSKFHEIWFPDGPDDPTVCLLCFRPDHAEYWDTSGVVGIKYMFENVRALVTGEAARDVRGQHGEVSR